MMEECSKVDAVSIEIEFEPSTTAPQVLGSAANACGHTLPTLAGGTALPGIKCAAPPVQSYDNELQLLKDTQAVNAARRISVVSLVASLLVGALALTIGYSEEILSLAGFGVEALLDGLSSALVLWRFKKPKNKNFVDAESAEQAKAARDAIRERNSSIGIGATFVFSAFMLILFAALKLFDWDPNEANHVEEEHVGSFYSALLACPSAVFFGGLAFFKFKLAKSLGSQVLEKDALCSVLGAILASICSVAAFIELSAESDSPQGMQVVDCVASLIIGLLLGGEGVRTLWHNLSSTRHMQF